MRVSCGRRSEDLASVGVTQRIRVVQYYTGQEGSARKRKRDE